MTPPPQSRARPELPSTTHRSMVTDEVLRELCERFKTNGYVVVEDYLDDYVVRACLNEFKTVLRCADALGLRRRKRVQRHQTDAFIAGAGRESGTRAMQMRVSVDWRRSVAWRR